MNETSAEVTLRYPSAEAPGHFPFEITYPGTWVAGDGPESIVVLRDASGGGHRAQTSVGADRVPAAWTLSDLASPQDDLTGRFTDLKVQTERAVVISEEPADVQFRTFRRADTDSDFFQMQVLLFSPFVGASTRELFRVHATCELKDVDLYVGTFVAIARSLRFVREAS